jgi:hypothetical protein
MQGETKEILRYVKAFVYFSVSLWIVIFIATANHPAPNSTQAAEEEQYNDSEAYRRKSELPKRNIYKGEVQGVQSPYSYYRDSIVPSPTVTVTSAAEAEVGITPEFTPTLSVTPSSSPTKKSTPTPSRLSLPTATKPKTTTLPQPTASADTIQSQLSFAGYKWTAEDSKGAKWGPGPNYFSPTTKTVSVDTAGDLNLRIWQKDGKWVCPNIVSTVSMGYGTYKMTIDRNMLDIDDNVVFGAFLYDERPTNVDPYNAYNREIDMLEVSRWSNAKYPNMNFTVWNKEPIDSRSYSYESIRTQSEYTITMIWQAGKVEFIGSPKLGGTGVERWIYTKDVPVPGQSKFMFNLWLHNSSAPKSLQEQTVIVKDFSYIPL